MAFEDTNSAGRLARNRPRRSAGERGWAPRVVAPLIGPSLIDADSVSLGWQRQLALTPATVAGLLTGLQRRALTTGTARNDPGPAQLTPKGAELFRSLAETVAPSTREVFASIAQEDLATTHRVLQQITEQAHRLQDSNAD